MRFAALALPLLLTAPAARGQEPTKNDLLRAVEKQLRAAHEAAGPCVACVVVSRSDQYPKPPGGVPGALGAFDRKQFLKDNPRAKPAAVRELDLSDPRTIPDHGFACGVVIDDKGLLLTPYHVIEGATKIYVHLPGRPGSYADIHAADARNDLAVLKLITPPPGLRAITFGDVKLTAGREKATVVPGTLVVLMANAFAANVPLDRPSAALGSVTNVHANGVAANSESVEKLRSYYYHGPLLEHDAKLNAGVSGAALLNLDGELIGLTTTAAVLGSGERGPEYALPVDDKCRRIIDVLKRGEEVEYGYLGVSLVTGRNNFNPNVVQIGATVPNGPSALAGLRENDIITHIDGVRIRKYEELLTSISAALAGSKVTLTVQRRDRTLTVPVTLGKMVHWQAFIASVRPDPVFGLRVDHRDIFVQGKNNNTQIELAGVPAGVSVSEVAPGSPAAAAFKKLGDNPKQWLITHVNGTGVGDPAGFYAAAKDQKAVKLTVIDPREPTGPGGTRRTREVSLP
ncbi:MAG TPA: PDZ domain-containing protein [Gemmata sp.]